MRADIDRRQAVCGNLDIHVQRIQNAQREQRCCRLDLLADADMARHHRAVHRRPDGQGAGDGARALQRLEFDLVHPDQEQQLGSFVEFGFVDGRLALRDAQVALASASSEMAAR